MILTGIVEQNKTTMKWMNNADELGIMHLKSAESWEVMLAEMFERSIWYIDQLAVIIQNPSKHFGHRDQWPVLLLLFFHR